VFSKFIGLYSRHSCVCACYCVRAESDLLTFLCEISSELKKVTEMPLSQIRYSSRGLLGCDAV
jgi:hypothetical protein